MKRTGGSVAEFVAGVAPAKRRRDADTLVTLMRDISGREPELWGTIVGFGSCHYRYPTGNEGDMPLLAFAPRTASSTIYLDAAAKHIEALAQLGPHTSSVTCLYVTDLEQVDQAVLRRILESAYAFSVSGGDDTIALTVTG